MPTEQYLTVRQFAAAAGVSPQSIYKAVDNRLSTYCKRENGVITISADALALYGCQPVVNQLSTEETPQESQKPDEQPAAGCQPVVNQVVNPEIELLRETIATLQEQLTVKDKQIEQLTAALTTALNTANAAQALHAGEIQARITAQEGADGKEPTDNGNDQSEGAASDPAQAPAKKSLFSRLFGKR